MRQLKIILLLVAFSCSVFAQDRLSLFISRANKYASVELSDYRKRLCVEYNMSNNSLDDLSSTYKCNFLGADNKQ